MSEGYGKDYTFWDALVKERFKEQLEKLGKPAYRNWEVFKSPKGRWMAFHNTSYMDIRVVDLETCEVVATDFYAKVVRDAEGKYDRDKSIYNHHTNVSTCVPIYQIQDSKPERARKFKYSVDMTDLEEKDREWIDWDKMISAPIAFNAYTYWAADFELYVDVLDLSKIDEGIIKKYPSPTNFVIPHGASHVRYYIACDLDFWIDLKPKEGEEGVMVSSGTTQADRGEGTIDFKILQERHRDRYSFNFQDMTGKLYDMYEGEEKAYKVEEEQPWEDTKRRIDEYNAKKENEK